MKEGLYELYLRFKEPLNTFWRRMQWLFFAITSVAVTITELLPLMANDALVPDEWKTIIRIVYGVAFGITLAARFTVQNPEELKEKKLEKEFNDKLEDHGK